MKEFLIVTALAVGCGVVGTFAGQAISDATGSRKVTHTIQCVDTASQETVYYLDRIKKAASEYDTWAFVLEDKAITYVQPSGVVCTVSESINDPENGTEVID